MRLVYFIKIQWLRFKCSLMNIRLFFKEGKINALKEEQENIKQQIMKKHGVSREFIDNYIENNYRQHLKKD